MAEDLREDAGEFYPGGTVIPKVPETPIAGGGSGDVALGGDQYFKSEIVDGVQHYKRVEIRYDADMADWGFVLVGDFVLEDGEMVEV